MNRNLIAAVTVVTAGVILSGCASQSTTESSFGDAVREVTMNQTYDLGASIYAEPEPIVGGDPYQLENVINAHRERSAQPQGAESAIGVGVGSNRSAWVPTDSSNGTEPSSNQSCVHFKQKIVPLTTGIAKQA
jgi:ABC-type Fe3+-hydroxamate transport system substrate-binding protein